MEYGIPYTLVTPGGSLSFNPQPSNQDGLYLTDAQGFDGGEVRANNDPLPQRDGAYVYDAPRGAAYPTLTGFTRASTTSARTTLLDNLKAYTDTIRRADGTLQFTPSGAAQRQLTVRLAGAVQIGNGAGLMKTFQLQLVAANPLVVASSSSSGSISALTGVGGALTFPMSFPFTFGDYSAGQVVVTPGGTTPAWPVVTITGPITAPTITNVTTGLFVSFPTLILSGTDVLTVDMYAESAVIGTRNVIGYLNATTSNFWSLTNGVANTVRVSGTSYTVATAATVTYRNTFI